MPVKSCFPSPSCSSGSYSVIRMCVRVCRNRFKAWQQFKFLLEKKRDLRQQIILMLPFCPLFPRIERRRVCWHLQSTVVFHFCKAANQFFSHIDKCRLDGFDLRIFRVLLVSEHFIALRCRQSKTGYTNLNCIIYFATSTSYLLWMCSDGFKLKCCVKLNMHCWKITVKSTVIALCPAESVF